ncbi:hypothetical protein I4U23_025546 [Adineta vaga]|nr:hypothetical protein I4U23_025546 [Adineta vaga]
MNTIMSTSIIPDIYRHTARKSTVSRNVKSQAKTVSTSLSITNACKEEPSIFDTIQCDVKLENDIPHVEQSFVIIPENEIEQMIVEQTNEDIVRDIIEQIQNQIHKDLFNQIDDINQCSTSISLDIYNTIDSIMEHFDENNNEQSINTTNTESTATTNELHTRDVTRSLNEDASMESDQQSSILSQLQVNDDDDIVEIEVSRSDPHPPLCACQCHQSTSNPTADYLLFEQALRQTRQEQQNERSLNNNRLIQTLKRQHQELMTFYQRQLYINKTDREQQTIQINQHDTQIQTDISTIQPSISKPNILQTNGKHSTPNAKSPTTVPIRPFNSFLTPIRTKGPSLQQLIPCLTTTTTATTTTMTNKISMLKKPATAPVLPPPLPPPPPTSQDVVDLTEEDDDDTNRNRLSTSSRPQQNSSSMITSTTSTPTQSQPISRSNPTTSLGQTFPLRPLPEHTPIDSSIARPQLNITQDNTSVRLTWNLPSTPMESIQNYEIYAYKHNATVTTSDWKKIGTVKSMRLPMAVTLKEFQPNSHYAFAVRGVSITDQFGPFCEPKTIFTGTTTPVQLNNTNQIYNGST